MAGSRKSRVIRIIVYGGLGLFLAALGLLGYLVAYHRPAPDVVSIHGDATAMGTQLGDASDLGLTIISRAYLQAILCGDRPELLADRGAAAWQALPPDSPYTREMAAMARATGIPRETIAYGNAFLDQGSARLGCRSLVYCPPAGRGHLHAHNLDWDDLGGAARWTVQVVRRAPSDGRHATVAIGFPGQIGAMDIVNEHGLALSFNQLGRGDSPAAEPVFIAIRRIAETQTTYAAARDDVLALPPGMPFLITLSDAKTGDAAIFERSKSGDAPVVERLPVDSVIAGNNSPKAHAEDRTTFDRAIRAHQPSDIASVQAALRDPLVLLPNNLYSIIWDYHGNRFYIASGTIPAAAASYRDYPLFPAKN